MTWKTLLSALKPFGRTRRLSKKPLQRPQLEQLESRELLATAVYVNDGWTSYSSGDVIADADPNLPGNQQVTFGTNAFATLADGIAAVSNGGIIRVHDGVYNETVTLTNSKTLVLLGTGTGAGNIQIQSLSDDATTTIYTTDNANHANTLTVSSGTLGGVIYGSGSLVKSGTGTLTLSGTNIYGGATTVSQGTIALGAAAVVPDASTVSVSGTFDLYGYSETVGGLTGSGTVTSTTSGNVTLTVGANGSSGTFSGVVEDGSGTLALAKVGAGTLTLSGSSANTFTGLTQVKDGTLTLAKNDSVAAFGGDLEIGDDTGAAGSAVVRQQEDEQIPNGAVISFGGEDGVLWNESGTETIASLSGDWNGGEVKVGGTLISSGDWDQTNGTTTLAGGTLKVGSSGLDDYNLTSGLLQGAGTITTAMVYNDGVIDPGTSNTSAGTITIQGNLELHSSGTLKLHLGGTSSGQYDKIDVTPNSGINSGNASGAPATLNSTIKFNGTLETGRIGDYLPNRGTVFDGALSFGFRLLADGSVALNRLPTDFSTKTTSDGTGIQYDPRFQTSSGQNNAVSQYVAANNSTLTNPPASVGLAKKLSLMALPAQQVWYTAALNSGGAQTRVNGGGASPSGLHQFNYVSVTNNTASTIPGPIYLEVNVTGGSAKLFNSAGLTSNGKPYLVIQNGSLAPGATTPNLTADWLNIGGYTVSFQVFTSKDLAMVSVADKALSEGNSGTANMDFTVTRTGNTGVAISVDYATTAGTATAGSGGSPSNWDYTTTTGTLNFAASETTKTISVPIRGDTTVESNETFTVSLSTSDANVLLTDASAQGTIVDDDPNPNLQFSSSSVSAGESAGTATITVTLSAASDETITVHYATYGITAAVTGDFTQTSGTLTFAPGDTSKTFTVTLVNDSIDEDDETIGLTLSGAVNAGIVPGDATLTITDNDDPPTVQFNLASYEISEAGDEATITVTLSAASERTAAVDFVTIAGTATATDDYTPVSGTLVFVPGETSLTFTVPILEDSLDEDNEAIDLTLSNPVHSTLGTSAATITILDNDAAPTVAFSSSNYSVNEWSGTATITVSLGAASGRDVTVNYATSDGTALAGQDYVSASGSLTFAPGQTSKTFTISILNDTATEGDETISIALSSPSNAALGSPTSGTLTITANDVTRIWDGGGTTNNWSDAENWVGDTAPADGDTVVFDDTGVTTRPTSVNDLTSLSVYELQLVHTSGSYNLSGNQLTVISSVDVAVPTGISGTLGLPIAGPAEVTKSGAGTLTLSSANAYTGTTTINAGAVRITNSLALGGTQGDTNVLSGGQLILDGSSITLAEPMQLRGTGPDSNGALYNASGANTVTGLVRTPVDAEVGSASGSLLIRAPLSGPGRPVPQNASVTVNQQPFQYYVVSISGMKNGEVGASNSGNLTADPTPVMAASWMDAVRQRVSGAATSNAYSPALVETFPGARFDVDTVGTLRARYSGNDLGSFEPDSTKVIVFEDLTDADFDDNYWVVTILSDVQYPSVRSRDCCGSPGRSDLAAPTGQASGQLGGNPGIMTSSRTGVGYVDGKTYVGSNDLSSGAGRPQGAPQRITNYAPLGAFEAGIGVVNSNWPTLVPAGPYTISLVQGGVTAWFDLDDNGNYVTRFYGQDTLVHDAVSHTFEFTDMLGNKTTFSDFDASISSNQRGQYQGSVNAGGQAITVTRDSQGRITETSQDIDDGSNTATESYLHTYYTAGVNAGRVASTTLRRKENGGSWVTVRTIEYTYYGDTEAHGKLGDQKTVTTKDASGNVIDLRYNRYYTADSSTGFTHGLKVTLGNASYARAAASLGDPLTATDAQIAPYADNFYEYDAEHRVTRSVVQGEGCSVCNGGLGAYTYVYEEPSGFSDGVNVWTYKTIETLPDGNQNTVYANAHGEVMLKVYKDTTTNQEWATYFRYDDEGRIILTAAPSAISGYDETKPDLLNLQAGNYQYLRDDEGLLSVYSYSSSTTATTSTPGAVAGYMGSVSIQRGEFGTPVPQSATTYIAATDGTTTVYLPATSTIYRNDDGTGEQTTTSSYTFFSGTVEVQSQTVTLPVVPTTQNGTGTASSVTSFVDVYGRPTWSKDADGFLTYTSYDLKTGAVAKIIVDVDTTQTSDFTNLPSGWATPSGGGLHLVTTFQNDSLGRVIKATDPISNITYTVYNDVNHEVRVYPGWNSATNRPTGPTQVLREDRAGGYTEVLTMSATPSLTAGRPNGTETISGIQSLARSYTSAGAQVIASDVYFSLDGLTYSTSASLGTEGVHFLRTRFDYDKQGLQNRIVGPDGVIRRTVYDGQGRLLSEWIGDSDTPTSGFWSPSNPADMVELRDYEYDNGGIGDGNLTSMTAYPGHGQPDLQTDYFYDWRDRLVATKSGVEATEATTVNRPISYVEYDNLSQAIAQEIYDGDTVSIVDANDDGVPDKPLSGLLRARSLSHFDEEGRVYRSEQVGVDPTTGSLSGGTLASNLTYDRRGNVVASANPLDETTTLVIDGAGRQSFVIDALSHATETRYDAASRVIGVVDALGHETTYGYDAANRLVTVTVPIDATTSATTTNEYDDAGRVGEVIDANGNSTFTYFDLAGRVKNVTNALSFETLYVYNNLGQLDSIENALGGITSFGYDSRGRQVSVSDPLTHTTTTEYDDLDRVLSTADALDHARTTTFDVVGRVNTVADALSRTTTYAHNVLSQVVAVIDPLDNTTATTYDPFGRVATVVDALSGTTTYGYDAASRVVSLTDPVGNTTTFDFDDASRLIAQTDPLSETATFTYDDANRLTSSTDRLGRRRDFTYDFASRKTAETWVAIDGTTVVDTLTVTYDLVGNQLTAINSAGTHTLVYDDLNRVVQSTQPTGVVLDFTYDALNRRIGIVDSLGGEESSTYDAASRLTSRTLTQTVSGGPDEELRVDYVYDAANRVTLETRYSDLAGSTLVAETARTYNDADQVTSIVTEDSSNTVIAEFEYTYDSKGRLESKTDNGVTTPYSYDDTDQLTSDNGTEYTWDPNGNRTLNGYVTGPDNRLLSDGTFEYTYDDEGNMTGKEEIAGDIKWTYGYDHRNQLVLVEKKSNGTDIDLRVEYKYETWGNRIEKSVDLDGDGSNLADIIKFVIDGWNPAKSAPIGNENVDVLADLDGSGDLTTRYLRTDRVDDLAARIDQAGLHPEAYWYLPDHLGSIREVLDNIGAVKDSIIHDAFGSIISESDAEFRGRYGFTGREIEAESELQYNRARAYAPKLGRWITRDPIGFDAGDSNLYRYVGNKPSVHLDPSGLDIIVVFDPTATAGGVMTVGHPSTIIGSRGSFWRYKSFAANNWLNKADNWTEWSAKSAGSALRRASEEGYSSFMWIETTEFQDTAAANILEAHRNSKYSLFSLNCLTTTVEAIEGAGVEVCERRNGDLVLPEKTYPTHFWPTLREKLRNNSKVHFDNLSAVERMEEALARALPGFRSRPSGQSRERDKNVLDLRAELGKVNSWGEWQEWRKKMKELKRGA